MVGRPVSRFASLAVVVLLLLVSTAAVPASAASTADDDTIHRTVTLALTPETPGEVAAVATFDLPDTVRSLETTLPERATVTDTNGFSRTGDRTYAWDGDTDRPSIRFTLDANESADTVRAHESGHTQLTGYSFVDAGPWAVVSVPQFSTNWRYTGDRPRIEKSVEIDGEGATGGEIAFLGDHRTVERSAHGQRFTLVVPDSADLEAEPDAILNSLAHAADALRVGDRDEHVFVVAAPTTVDWGSAGIAYGGSDVWVRADEPLDRPRNVWLHEYVHTRQDYRTTPETRWTKEATAEYYAAFLSLQQERIGFDAFKRQLDRGADGAVADDVLADPGTWSANTPYLKGSLVFGGFDRRVRLESNGSNAGQALLSRMNAAGDEVHASDLRRFAVAAGGDASATFLERYTTTTDAPDAWTRTEHEAAFSTLPARVSYAAGDLRIAGPTRDEPFDDTVLTTGESLTATVDVANTGGVNGTYETELSVDGTVVASRTGTVAPGSTETVTLSHTFAESGTYSVSVAGTSHRVVVEEPATPQVRELDVDATREDGDWTAAITVTLTNPADRPARGSVPVHLDGSLVSTIDATLATGATSTHTLTTSISPGEHTIEAGGVSTTIEVPRRPTSIPVPGFGPLAAALALLLAATAARHR